MTELMFCNNEKIEELKHKVNISNITEVDPDLSLVEIDNGRSGSLEVNVGIAQLITSLSRLALYRYKKYCLDNGIKIFYFDTDSIFTNAPLPKHFISNKLGDLKLEYIFKDSVFLGPKMYAGLTIEDKLVVKFKGFKNTNKLSLLDIKTLLVQDIDTKLTHTKWFKNLFEGTINVLDSNFTLRMTANKRNVNYVNGIATTTTPFTLKINESNKLEKV